MLPQAKLMLQQVSCRNFITLTPIDKSKLKSDNKQSHSFPQTIEQIGCKDASDKNIDDGYSGERQNCTSNGGANGNDSNNDVGGSGNIPIRPSFFYGDNAE